MEFLLLYAHLSECVCVDLGLERKEWSKWNERKPRGSSVATKNPTQSLSLWAFYSSAIDILYRCSDDVVARIGLFCFTSSFGWLMLFHCNFIPSMNLSAHREFHPTIPFNIYRFDLFWIFLCHSHSNLLYFQGTFLMDVLHHWTNYRDFHFFFLFLFICSQKLQFSFCMFCNNWKMIVWKCDLKSVFSIAHCRMEDRYYEWWWLKMGKVLRRRKKNYIIFIVKFL